MNRIQTIIFLERTFLKADVKNKTQNMIDILTHISTLVIPEFARGGVNPDFIKIHSSDICSVACIIAGYKKVALW